MAEPVGRGYPDLHEHLASLDDAGLLVRVTRPVNKDTELHPLVRWEFLGGFDEPERRGFLFENVVDSRGRRFDIPVAVGVYAASRRIYSLGLGCPVEDVRRRWAEARARAVAPVQVSPEDAPCQQVVLEGEALDRSGGVDGLPVPISTPGWDNAPYFTAAHYITRDPDSGVHNIGNYRAMLKAPRRVGLNCSVEVGQDIDRHFQKYRARGERMPAAICVGGPPCIGYVATQKVPYDVSEYDVAGGLVGAPLRVVPARTVPLLVPADAEIVIEGYVDTQWLEPEGPFGESHGHMNPKEYNAIMDVTAITRRRDAVLVSLVSQVGPSEASVMGRAAAEAQFLQHLREHCGLRGVVRVALHEPLTNRLRITIVQFHQPAPSEVLRALMAAAGHRPAFSKMVVGIDDDIDPDNADALLWAMVSRSTPSRDVRIIDGMDAGHAPRHDERWGRATDAYVLWDATLKHGLPPVSLPKREFMEQAAGIWAELGLPPLKRRMPWYGYSLGDWRPELEEEAKLAAAGRYLETGEKIAQQRVPTAEVSMNTSYYGGPADTAPAAAERDGGAQRR